MAANNCNLIRTNLAAQTPVYSDIFLEDFKPLDSAVMGRHETGAWPDGTADTMTIDKMQVGQPDLSQSWQRISGSECDNACSPPRVHVAFGTDRSTYFMEQMELTSQLFCLTQLRHQTKPGEQIGEIMKGLKKIPEIYTSDFLRVHAFDKSPEVEICGSSFGTFVPSSANTTGQLTTINLGASGNLPSSELTFTYLDYLSTGLDLDGYSNAGSGLPDGMCNLITDKRAWFKLTNGNPSMKDMMALDDPQKASPLYRIGEGIQKPFGNYAPTLDKTPIRFEHVGSGVLQRVYPYINTTATTGIKRIKNPAYLNARYQLSFIWHPKAVKLWTPSFKKLNEKIPSVNTAMFGTWTFVNPQGVLQYTMPDGTACTKNNDTQNWFYWLCRLELGFQYKYSEFIRPILHLVDGSGKDVTVDSPVCGTAPQYTAQDYTDNPVEC